MFRDWTLDETLFVRDYAGTVPLSDLARHLRRDARDVAGECARLGVPFVYVGTPLFWCDECASWARRVDKSGRCDKCRSRHYLQRIEAKTAALMERLPLEQRETYARFESKRGGRVRDAPPLAPDTSGMPPREAVAAATAYLANLSDWGRERNTGPANRPRSARSARHARCGRWSNYVKPMKKAPRNAGRPADLAGLRYGEVLGRWRPTAQLGDRRRNPRRCRVLP